MTISTKQQLRDAIAIESDVTIPNWASCIYGSHEYIYASNGVPGAETRNIKIHHVEGANWTPAHTIIEVINGEMVEPGHRRQKLAIMIVGGPNTGKTMVQRIITKALQEAGIGYDLGENAQHELESACLDEALTSVAIAQINRNTSVMVEEIHTHALRRFELPGETMISFKGYDHSSGFKILPVYKDKD